MTAITVQKNGLVRGSEIVGRTVTPSFPFFGQLDHAADARFLVAMGNMIILVLPPDGTVLGAEIVARQIRTATRFVGAHIGNATEDRFMAAIGNILIVLRTDGLAFGAEVGRQQVEDVFEFNLKNPASALGTDTANDHFMAAIGTTLIVNRRDGLTFGARVLGREIQPVFEFGDDHKNRLGTAPEDKFLITAGNNIAVVRGRQGQPSETGVGLAFGADVSGGRMSSIFEYGGALIGEQLDDRFIVTVPGTASLVPQAAFGSAAHWELILLPVSDEVGGGPEGGKSPFPM
jgi:hypothetical protein